MATTQILEPAVAHLVQLVCAVPTALSQYRACLGASPLALQRPAHCAHRVPTRMQAHLTIAIHALLATAVWIQPFQFRAIVVTIPTDLSQAVLNARLENLASIQDRHRVYHVRLADSVQ